MSGSRYWYSICVVRQHACMRGLERFAQEDGAECKREDLRNRETEPHHFQLSRLRQQPSRRQQHHELTAHGVNQRVQRIADGLEHGAGDNAEACEQEVNRDNPEGGNADLAH